MTLEAFSDWLKEKRKRAAWAKTVPVPNDPEMRIDCDGRYIRWSEYGQLTLYGWEIDHIVPVALGGTDDWSNLRARHYVGNRSDGGVIGNLGR